jgi:MYXO-CTERM domain-containing protein
MMKISVMMGVLAAAGLAASASAQSRGVDMGGVWGLGHGGNNGGAGNDGPTVYSQPSQGQDGLFSDGVAGQFWSQRIADNFVLDNNYVVDGIRWWGSSENYIFDDLTNFGAFIIEFYDDAGGTPGASIGQFSVDIGDANATPTGLMNGNGGHEYQLEAPVNIALNGGTQYWVSVGSKNLSPGDDGFIWSLNFNEGDGNIAADFFDGFGYSTFGGFDMAFELTGVPTPGSAALLGLAGLAASRRRRA